MSQFWKPGTERPRPCLVDDEEGGVLFYSTPPPSSSYGYANLEKQRQRLPVFKYRTAILYLVEYHSTVIIVGETGSGKTTQIPQYLKEAGWAEGGRLIACTQPRRLAVQSVASRVAEEMGVKIGEEVGYTIRFEDKTVQGVTKIKFLTDGVLLREMMDDPLLIKYSVIMVDEAHERSISTDMLLGLLKKIQRRRPELRLIISSATIEAESMSNFFRTRKKNDGHATDDNNLKMEPSILSVEGKGYPVEIHYVQEPVSDYLQSAVDTVLLIHEKEAVGDVLVFLTGQEEIDAAVQLLVEKASDKTSQFSGLLVLPLYSGLSRSDQDLIFSQTPKGKRKVVISTNIAETSLTLEGVVYVVDSGFSKQRFYNPLKALGIDNILGFDWLASPPPEAMIRALEVLYSLGILDEDAKLTTPSGFQVAEIPLDPMVSKMIIAADTLGCSEEILTIAAVLSVQSIWVSVRGKHKGLDEVKLRFAAAEGDHVTHLNVYKGFFQSGKSSQWCYKNYINYHAMKKVVDTREQLCRLVRRLGIVLKSCQGDTQTIRKAILAGFFSHASQLEEYSQNGMYKTVRNSQEVYIHPSSVLFRVNPKWVVYHSLVSTDKHYMHNVIAIDPSWLIEAAPHFYQLKRPNPAIF
ncbi:hypothetical protein KFK09_026310 [Dendrobium nobile]|uniref:RNA helicase n=1 Tax=Dendrobium nobile TaxID=94219 RepID=A0A8T3ACK0_DENNO|nr:hypothetical protein KFK09_026310 [Dendrobium nobile]